MDFIGHNIAIVDANGIVENNAMRININYHHMHASIQSVFINMLKEAKLWAIREPHIMFHSLVPANILKQYCNEH